MSSYIRTGSVFKPTKEKGKVSSHTEDTISSFNKSGLSGHSPIVTETILREFGYLVMREMVKNNRGFFLPNNFGLLRVVGAKSKAKDKKNTKEYNKKIYFKNILTNGYVYRLTFDFAFSFPHKTIYNFESSWGSKAAVKDQIKKGFSHFEKFNSFTDYWKFRINPFKINTI